MAMLVLQAVKPRLRHFFADLGHVVVGADRRRADDVGIAHAVGAAMRPVDGNAVAQLAAEQLVHRHAQRLALDVEQRVLDGRDRLAHHAAARLRRLGGEHGIDQLDLHRVHADHVGHQRLDHAGEAGAAEALVELRPADDAVLGRDLEEREDRQPASQRKISWPLTFSMAISSPGSTERAGG